MWEDRARKASHVGNQAAGFTRCLAEVQIKLGEQVKLLKDTIGKGKKAPPTDAVAIIEEIQYLVSFNQAISGNLARAVSDMTGGILVDLANITLVRRDSYLANVRFGLGASPRVVTILREGYILPFHLRPNLTREPVVRSGYAHAPRMTLLMNALHALRDKQAVELVSNPNSLAFYNRLFLVPKPNNKWRPILDLSSF